MVVTYLNAFRIAFDFIVIFTTLEQAMKYFSFILLLQANNLSFITCHQKNEASLYFHIILKGLVCYCLSAIFRISIHFSLFSQDKSIIQLLHRMLQTGLNTKSFYLALMMAKSSKNIVFYDDFFANQIFDHNRFYKQSLMGQVE